MQGGGVFLLVSVRETTIFRITKWGPAVHHIARLQGRRVKQRRLHMRCRACSKQTPIKNFRRAGSLPGSIAAARFTVTEGRQRNGLIVRDHPPSGPPGRRVGMTAEACLFVASS